MGTTIELQSSDEGREHGLYSRSCVQVQRLDHHGKGAKAALTWLTHLQRFKGGQGRDTGFLEAQGAAQRCCMMPKLPGSTAVVCRERGCGAREQPETQKERQSPAAQPAHWQPQVLEEAGCP